MKFFCCQVYYLSLQVMAIASNGWKAAQIPGTDRESNMGYGNNWYWTRTYGDMNYAMQWIVVITCLLLLDGLIQRKQAEIRCRRQIAQKERLATYKR